MIKVKSVLEAIFMNNRKGLKNEKVSMRKNSVQYMSEMENIYFRYTATPSERNDGCGVDISSSLGK